MARSTTAQSCRPSHYLVIWWNFVITQGYSRSPKCHFLEKGLFCSTQPKLGELIAGQWPLHFSVQVSVPRLHYRSHELRGVSIGPSNYVAPLQYVPGQTWERKADPFNSCIYQNVQWTEMYSKPSWVPFPNRKQEWPKLKGKIFLALQLSKVLRSLGCHWTLSEL